VQSLRQKGGGDAIALKQKIVRREGPFNSTGGKVNSIL